MLGTFHLTVLHDILKSLHFLYQPEKIYALLMDQLTNALNAEAASIFELDAAKQNLILKVCMGPKQKYFEMVAEKSSFPVGHGICGWVAQYNQPSLVEDTQKSSRFNPKVDTLTGYKTRSIICAPLSTKDEVLGVIEILNKKASAFSKNELDLVALIAKQAAIAIENCKLYNELNAARNFSESVLLNLSGGMISVDVNGVVTHVNPSAENILKLSAAESVGKPCSSVLESYRQLQEVILTALESRERKLRQEVECIRYDGVSLRIGYSTFLVQDKTANLLGAGIIFQNLNTV